MDSLQLRKANRLHEDIIELARTIRLIGERSSVECIYGTHRVELLEHLTDASILDTEEAGQGQGRSRY